MLTAESQWVALYTNPRAEKKVEQLLAENGYETYLPLRRELHTWSDRKKWVETPLLKSYIFVKITKTDEIKVREITGVVCIIKFGNDVAIIPEYQIQMMKDFLAAEVAVQVRNAEQLKRGRWVRINSGSLTGRVGMLVSDCEEGNFAVEITGISMAMVIHVDQEMLEPAADYEIPEKTVTKKQYNIR